MAQAASCTHRQKLASSSSTSGTFGLSVVEMRWFFLLLALSAQAYCAGLRPYSQLVVADPSGQTRKGVRVTYLGTNGYQFEFAGHAFLVDPYFSRVDLWSVALG